MLGLDGIHRASSSRIGPRASARSSRLTTIGLSRRFLAGSNAAADNYRIGNARSSFHGGLSRTRVRLPPPPPNLTPVPFKHSRPGAGGYAASRKADGQKAHYILETVPLLLFVTQTFAPSKATANGKFPTLNVPSTAPSRTCSFVTVLLPLFVTQTLLPSNAMHKG